MKNKIICWLYKIPNNYKGIWYNRAIFQKDFKFPKVFDSDKKYIKPVIGNKYIMKVNFDFKLSLGYHFYYEITDLKTIAGGNFLHKTDFIDCDMVFSHMIIFKLNDSIKNMRKSTRVNKIITQ